MKTRVFKVDPASPDPEAIAAAAAILRAGGLVAFPTETVYGLGANGLDAAAIERLFAVKGRPPQKGLILALARGEDWADLVEEIPRAAERLRATFTPGPLTIVLRARPQVPEVVRGGGDTLAVRWPDHPVTRALILAAGCPVAAPSANLSGAPAPTEAGPVLADFGGQIDAILDAGPTPLRVASTIVDLTVSPPAVLREGVITAEQVQAVLAQE